MNSKNKKLAQQLIDAGVISEGRVYRMRLFSPTERHNLRHAISEPNSYLCAEGCAGMMDELQMVNWQAHGKDKIERQI